MNAKLVVAVFLALQVSLSLGAIPSDLPSQELVDKYIEMRNTFMRRLQNLYAKIDAAAAANENAQAAREAIAGNEKVNTARNVLGAVGQEYESMIEPIRNKALGAYEYYLRPYVGETLQQGINHAKGVLDQVMPADK